MKILDIDVMLLMIFTYRIGIVPALISGLLHQVPIHLMSSRFPRLIASAPIGAAAMITLITDSTKYLVGLFDHSIA
jgi:hypothetical protein